jgi:hypothetical protein
LIAWEFHGHAQAAENAEDRLTRLWVKRIDEAGDKELHGRHATIVI